MRPLDDNPQLPAAATSRGKFNFLLVDDDSVCQFIHRRVLETSAVSDAIHTAENGKKALDALELAAAGMMALPDVILLDLVMPQMNGIEFLRAFRELDCPDKKRIAIIVLTSSVSDRDRSEALALGAFQCLSKPLTAEALKKILKTLPVYSRL